MKRYIVRTAEGAEALRTNYLAIARQVAALLCGKVYLLHPDNVYRLAL